MYLSKLEIIGFKSFAQKVNLTFDSGISSIVGPNGCGKTNIVDAIRWVLGEQRYSALRSEKMEDVIFNGTKTRKPLGMAEASLVIENTKGILPSEYSQVTVGRRVYRSGESEYLLNKVPCRLKDILDLFMDTGMGADAYSVIELKMVETILSDKTEDRRRLFEEAAGVTKYKHRRKAAYRKLESVQADLMRVNDIVAEVHKAVTSLERQAKKAEQYHEVHIKLKALEIDVMEREYAHLFSRITPLEERLQALSADKNKIDVDLSQEESQLEALRGMMSDVEKRLAEAQRDVAVHMETVNKIEQRGLVAAERMKALESNIARFEAEKLEMNEELQRLEGLKSTLNERIRDLQEQERLLSAEFAEKQSALRESKAHLDSRKAEAQALNDRTFELVHRTAEIQAVQDRKKGRVENLHGRQSHAEEEIAAYEQEIQRVDADNERLSAEDKVLRRQFTEAEVRFYDAENNKNQLKSQIDALQLREVELRGEIGRRAARIDLLKAVIESREGVSEGVRFLASTEKWSPKRRLTIADAINAEDKYRTAIESALGEYSGFIVVDSVSDAERGIALLNEEQLGKSTFVCLDRLPEINSSIQRPNIRGVVGWAIDLARFDAAYAPLFKLVLDRVLIVENSDVAAKVARQMVGVRCVTLAGEVVTGIGLTKGGSRRQDEGGTIGKQAQIEQLGSEIASLQNDLEVVKKQREEIQSSHDAIDLRSFTDAVKGIEKEMNGVEMRMAQLQFEKKRAGDIIAKNKEEIGIVAAEVSTLSAEIEESEPALDALRREKTDVERRVGAISNEIEALERDYAAESRVVSDLEIALVKLTGELHNAQSDIKRADYSIVGIQETLTRRDEAIRQAQEEIGLAQAILLENANSLELLTDELTLLEQRKSDVYEESTQVREDIHRIELRIKDERRQHDDSMKATHELELKIAELKAKAEHIKARALEEFEFTVELKSYPDEEFVDFAALREEIQRFRDKVKSLGNINFAAFEEYNTEKQRLEFLTGQRADLIEAEKILLATIEEINTTAQNKFMQTFELIRKNFVDIFKSLFDPGDECDLKLEEGVDPLEATIDIIAKPRGKRPTSIGLLSGGEKTLTATALLFAIYLVKPSPFCILDEVDAPLDDANIDRFTRLLKKFSNNTQFIVVTHNKRTMEAANALYGVTMEEEGVSKLVTVRFNQATVRSAELVSG
ncbi:MAG: Smc family protein [Bacteroidetes bacterium]|nr:Smc family protein [Bacteroidota bacterium]